MSLDVRLLGPEDASILLRVAPDVFDGQVDARWSKEFLSDPRHHLVVALDGEIVVGMASAVHYVHPDKAPQLFINELAVATSHQNRGIGQRLLASLLGKGRALRCTEAWVLTEESNTFARRLYASGEGVRAPSKCVMYTFDFLQDDPQ